MSRIILKPKAINIILTNTTLTANYNAAVIHNTLEEEGTSKHV